MKRKSEPPAKRTASPFPDPSQDLLVELRQWIHQARILAARAVDVRLCGLYWRIGTRIRKEILNNRRAEYGAGIVSAVGRQLEQKGTDPFFLLAKKTWSVPYIVA
jgi:hypothetical protein